MSYFADLTPHTYSPNDGLRLLNIGWLDAAVVFTRGTTPQRFHEALRVLCRKPVYLHRGWHWCPFCARDPSNDLINWPTARSERVGNGQIRVQGEADLWYVAPTLIHHYIVSHEYQPPAAFIEAVLKAQ